MRFFVFRARVRDCRLELTKAMASTLVLSAIVAIQIKQLSRTEPADEPSYQVKVAALD